MIDQNLKSSETQWELTKLKELNRALVVQRLVKAQDTTKIIIPNLGLLSSTQKSVVTLANKNIATNHRNQNLTKVF